MPRWSRIGLALLLLVATGCAASGPPRGQTGSITWEVVDAAQRWEEQGTRMRWDYVLSLQNTGSRGLYLSNLEIGGIGPELYGGMGMERLGQRLEPGSTLRWSRSDSYGCPRCPLGEIPGLMNEGMTKLLTVHGVEDGGQPVRVQIQIPLNSRFGRK